MWHTLKTIQSDIEELIMSVPENLKKYLCPTSAIDCDTPSVIDFAHKSVVGAKDKKLSAVKLFYAVRDGIRYNPYGVDPTRNFFTASKVLAKGEGFCVEKALLLAAAARVLEIPSRLGFADIRNHQIPEKMRAQMKTDIFAFHGYTELFLDGKWTKATPAFDLPLCERQEIYPVEFDGTKDAVFENYDKKGRLHIEYIRYYGVFEDVPQEKIIEGFREYYPTFFDEDGYLILPERYSD
ncbi:MAG: transglutaminase family protein [Syntrophales bacterium]|jgi:transglutaminase-like putative cysteine protease|nr:transglutaminase family protein [Syntrophales bacterium]